MTKFKAGARPFCYTDLDITFPKSLRPYIGEVFRLSLEGVYEKKWFHEEMVGDKITVVAHLDPSFAETDLFYTDAILGEPLVCRGTTYRIIDFEWWIKREQDPPSTAWLLHNVWHVDCAVLTAYRPLLPPPFPLTLLRPREDPWWRRLTDWKKRG